MYLKQSREGVGWCGVQDWSHRPESTRLQIPSKAGMPAPRSEYDTSGYRQSVEGGRETVRENLRRLKTRQFAVFWMSCTATEESTLTGWLQANC